MLYLVSTPIGNLSDFTYRAVDILKECDLILCEDTRTSKGLLDKYNIDSKLASFHQFNEKKIEDVIIGKLKEGQRIGMISDAGTPLVSDPGFYLVQRCREENIDVRAIPGASSVLAALVVSGFNTEPFSFMGFLPKKEMEKQRVLKRALCFEGTFVFFETAKRLQKTLIDLKAIGYRKNVFVARELTKKFEEHLFGSVDEVIEKFKTELGEIVVILEGTSIPKESLDPVEIIQTVMREWDLPLKEAVKMGAKLLKEDKRSLYKKMVDHDRD